ncbi:hypothetical protein NMG60_11020899 [Bertholletia excelsa]
MKGGGSCREVERRILRLLHGHKTRTQLPQIHAHFLRHYLHQSNQILSHFVSVCSSLSKMPYAHLVFRQTHNPNIFLFNSMIKGYSLSPPFENSLQLFSDMKRRGIWPDEFTFAPLIKSCSNLLDLRAGEGVQAAVIALGFERFGSIRIGVSELYVACGRMDDAQKLFNEMPHRDVIVWNLMIRGFFQIGDVEMCLRLFGQMSERSIASWNIMISGLARSGRDTEALEVFHEMRECGFGLDEATVVSILPVCARLGAVDSGERIHSYAMSSGLYLDNISVGNSLVDFYCKCGILETGFTLFKDMPRKNIVSWNTMISGMAFNGKGELGINLFEEMISKGVNPNDATFVGVLACCAHAGFVQKGRDLFAAMTKEYLIDPKLEHYGSMVDLLGRSGCVKEAHDLICTMQMKPNAAIWGALLSACHTHNNMELAEHAVKWLIDLEPWNSGNYVLLSNIYAERGKWNEVETVRMLMRETSVKKAPGQSMVG